MYSCIWYKTLYPLDFTQTCVCKYMFIIKTFHSCVWWVPRDKTIPHTSYSIDLSHHFNETGSKSENGRQTLFLPKPKTMTPVIGHINHIPFITLHPCGFQGPFFKHQSMYWWKLWLLWMCLFQPVRFTILLEACVISILWLFQQCNFGHWRERSHLLPHIID